MAAAVTNLPVKTSQGLSADEYIYIGEPGNEKSELVKITAVVDTLNLTVPALSYSHNEGDAVISSRWNQIRIYKASSLNGTYTLLTTVDIDPDNPDNVTVYDDTVGTSTDYYKITYYNSTSTLVSDYSDPIPGSGVAANTVRSVTDNVLKEARDESEAIASRDEILSWMNDCQADVKARRRKWAFLYTRAVGNTVADTEAYDIDTTFGVTDIDIIDHLDYQYDDGANDNTYRLQYVPKEEFDRRTQNNDEDSSDALSLYTFDEAMDYIRLYPKPATSSSTVLYLYYYKDIPYLDSDGDELLIPDTRIYRFYCLHEFYLKKGDIGISDRYAAKYEQALAGLVRQQRREVGSPRGFRYLPERANRFYGIR